MYSERANFNSTILPNKLSPEHIKWKLVADFSSKHCKSILALALISHRGTLYIEKIIDGTSIYCT